MDECKYICGLLSDYLDGEVAEDECRFMEEHLEACLPCSMMYESLKTSVALCGQAIPENLPENVRVELKAFLRDRCKQQ